MTHILIAAFDRYDDAQQAKAELVRRGISADDIQLSASMNAQALDSDGVEVIGEEPGEDASVAEKIGSFFSKVFGDESSKHAGRYPEAARRGSTIVTVSLTSESQLAAVEDTLIRLGAIDIDERSAEWGSDDATPVTASTETLTTGYPDAASISVDQGELDGSATPDRGQDDGTIPGRAENEKAGRRDNSAGRVRIIPR
jgi:hypothetical protein